ncbi:MAG TPA: FHA domain-containing protein [Gemmatimonadaceae bacterium]
MDGVILRHLGGSRVGCVQRFPADQDGLVLGHDAYADVRFDAARDRTVARQHACIIPLPRHPGRFAVVDLDSRHGTYVNLRRVDGAAPLAPGDVVQLGPGGPELQFDLSPLPVLVAALHADHAERAACGAPPAVLPVAQGILAPLSTAEMGSRPRST